MEMKKTDKFPVWTFPNEILFGFSKRNSFSDFAKKIAVWILRRKLLFGVFWKSRKEKTVVI
jgi:hypothetical protein